MKHLVSVAVLCSLLGAMSPTVQAQADDRIELRAPVVISPSILTLESLDGDRLRAFRAEDSRQGIRPDSTVPFVAMNWRDSARRAADVDPGILILPDHLLKDSMIIFTPRGNVDPEMILPRMILPGERKAKDAE